MSYSLLAVSSRVKEGLCPHCLFVGKTKADLNEHVRSVHYKIDVTDVEVDPGNIQCRYCLEVVKELEYKNHLSLAHLDVHGSLHPTAFSLNPSTSKGGLVVDIPPVDNWIIDYSQEVFHDPVFKPDWLGNYKSYFHLENDEPSYPMSRDYLKYFIYSNGKRKEAVTRYNWKCPGCKVKFASHYCTLRMLILGASAHMIIYHDEDSYLKKLAETELQFFNVFYKTNFKVGEKPTSKRPISDFILTGPEAEFMIEELRPMDALPSVTLSKQNITCKYCLQYHDTEDAFISHLVNHHNYLRPRETPKSK
ncbi:hypothetical protein FO519_006244 [Halicephalobus sp. NKZ332]|nr:hypothetical protein FO519_006244 [Halicephalobus sp. NKZ332]